MKSHELKTAVAPDRKRVGRGISSGTGKTAGRGTKGQNARTGGGVRPGFEGGQTSLARRLPKRRGFTAFRPTIYAIINLDDLNQFKDGALVDIAALMKAGLARGDVQVKLLGDGALAKKLTVRVDAASKNAVAKVQQAGGKLELVVK